MNGEAWYGSKCLLVLFTTVGGEGEHGRITDTVRPYAELTKFADVGRGVLRVSC